MTDDKLRGAYLRKLYDERESGDFVFFPKGYATDEQKRETSRICRQLAESGLIEWKPLAPNEGGMGRITGWGTKIIEGKSQSPIAITFHHNPVTVTHSSNVQVGNSNALNVNIDIAKINAAIDNSNVSEQEKQEAKSLWAKLTANATFAAIVSAILSIGSPAH